MNGLHKRVSIFACVILAISLFYVPYEALRSNSTAIVGLILGMCLVYSFTRIIRDIRRRKLTPPLFPWLFDGNDDGVAGRLAPIKSVRWTKSQTAKWMLMGLASLITGFVIVILNSE